MGRLVGNIRRLQAAQHPQWFAAQIKWLDPFFAEPSL